MLSASVAVAGLAAGSLAIWRRRITRSAGSEPDPRRELISVALHLARGARAGMTTADAIVEAAGRADGVVQRQLRSVCSRMDRGSGLEGSLRAWSREATGGAARRGAPDPDDVSLLTAAAAFAEGHGSGLAEAFEGVAAALVDRAELVDEVAALTSQARASVAVLCALPVLGLALVGAIDPAVPAALVSTRVGLASLAAAIGLDVAAVLLGVRLTGAVRR